MLNGQPTKPIPRSLQECTYPNEAAYNLYAWAERLKAWGQKLLYVLLVIGLISSIIDAVNIAEVNEDQAFTVFLASAFSWALYAIIEFCAFHVLALLVNALATITQNTAVTANVALYESSLNHPYSVYPSQQAVMQQPVAKTQTTNMHGSVAPYPQAHPAAPVAPDMWVCKNCGTKNKNAYGQCKKCGRFRS